MIGTALQVQVKHEKVMWEIADEVCIDNTNELDTYKLMKVIDREVQKAFQAGMNVYPDDTRQMKPSNPVREAAQYISDANSLSNIYSREQGFKP